MTEEQAINETERLDARVEDVLNQLSRLTPKQAEPLMPKVMLELVLPALQIISREISDFENYIMDALEGSDEESTDISAEILPLVFQILRTIQEKKLGEHFDEEVLNSISAIMIENSDSWNIPEQSESDEEGEDNEEETEEQNTTTSLEVEDAKGQTTQEN